MPTTYANPIPGLRLFHGSPHDFDRFSMSKIGTGEGAQAYGHGLYFAENEGIARSYRDNLLDARIPQVNERLKELSREMGKISSGYRQWKPGFADEGKALAEEYDSLLDERSRMKGRMYEVSVNANPEDFLDWDKPLSEQSQRVRDVLGQFGMKYDEAASNDFDNALLAALFNDAPGPLPKRPINPTGNDIYMRSTLRNFAVQDDAGRWGPGASTYDESLAAAGGDPKRVRAISTGGAPDRSEALRRAGIPGIRYLDAGSRYTPSNLPDNPIANEARAFLDQANGDAAMALRLFNGSNPVERFATTERDEVRKVIEAAGRTATRNYVVFDENLIEIVRKYGIAGAAAMLGISQADLAQAMQQQQPRGLLSGAQ
jgi:hypothetical protein